MDIKKRFKAGVIWVSLFSMLSFILGFLRNYWLSNEFKGGDVMGSFALIMLFYNSVTTFGLFGGASLLSTFLPKYEDIIIRRNFFLNNLVLSIIISFVFFGTLILFPDFLSILFNNKISLDTFFKLLWLIPFIIGAQLLIYWLQGNLEYKKAAFLSQFQVIGFTIVLGGSLFFDSLKKHIIQDSYLFFIICFLIINILIIFYVVKIERFKLFAKGKFKLCSRNFFTAGISLHLSTILTFIYLYYDQIMITKYIGLKELGVYFLILQLVDLIRFIPQKLGQVFLTGFSKVLGNKENKENKELLREFYEKVTSNLLLLNAIVTIFLLIGFEFLFAFFNIRTSDYWTIFVLLILVRNISSLGGVNSMLILSKEKNRPFLYNSIIIIVIQGVLIYFTINTYGIISVVYSQLISTSVGQIGLWLIIRKNIEGLSLPKGYFLNIVIVLIAFVGFYLSYKEVSTVIILAVFILFFRKRLVNLKYVLK